MIRSHLNVDIGQHNLLNPDPWSINRKISKIFIHDSYSPNGPTSDIGLLKLDRPVTFEHPNIVPACVANSTDNFEDKIGWITGYGSQFTGGSGSTVLRQVEVPIHTNLCVKTVVGFDLAAQVCAGGY